LALLWTALPFVLFAQTPVIPTPTQAVPAPAVPWDYKTFMSAIKASGRDSDLTEADFKQAQEKKKKAADYISDDMKQRIGEVDPEILRAFNEVPREYFQYQYEKKESIAAKTYEMPAHPWAIGYGSALSDYPGQVYMVHLAQPEPTDTVLEIGTGSGYNIALLSRLVKNAYSIEIIKPLGSKVSEIFKPIGYDNVHTKVGDGYYGWPKVKAGFDIIMVTCAAQYVPPALIRQLKPHGRLVIPIGQPFRGRQVLYVYTKDSHGKVHARKDAGVYFIPMTGEIQKKIKAAKEAKAADL
jgi:protein-L-isoaspartate(D-aspartate) O-methyltransferase